MNVMKRIRIRNKTIYKTKKKLIFNYGYYCFSCGEINRREVILKREACKESTVNKRFFRATKPNKLSYGRFVIILYYPAKDMLFKERNRRCI